jgi:hypothetical protein
VLDAESEPSCICDKGFSGEHCEYEENSVPNCSLDCSNGGICSYGISPSESSSYWQGSDSNHFYCQCPENYDGIRCEIVKTPCGDDYCYYGSQCVSRTQVDRVSGTTSVTTACDCSTADVNVAGRFCQFKQTSFCRAADFTNSAIFCVNEGSCPSNPLEGCSCPPGFDGFSCEFAVPDYESNSNSETTEIPVDPENVVACLLECYNGGTCRKGSKEQSSIVSSLASNSTDLTTTHSEDYEHCVCPQNFTGLQCTTLVEACEDTDGDENPDHFCFNGGVCTTATQYRTGSNDFRPGCNCTTATVNESPVTGTACQHESSSICTVGFKEVGQILSFCANGGTCISHVNPGERYVLKRVCQISLCSCLVCLMYYILSRFSGTKDACAPVDGLEITAN